MTKKECIWRPVSMGLSCDLFQCKIKTRVGNDGHRIDIGTICRHVDIGPCYLYGYWINGYNRVYTVSTWSDIWSDLRSCFDSTSTATFSLLLHRCLQVSRVPLNGSNHVHCPPCPLSIMSNDTCEMMMNSSHLCLIVLHACLTIMKWTSALWSRWCNTWMDNGWIGQDWNWVNSCLLVSRLIVVNNQSKTSWYGKAEPVFLALVLLLIESRMAKDWLAVGAKREQFGLRICTTLLSLLLSLLPLITLIISLQGD